MEQAHATLDSPALRARLRYQERPAEYISRDVARPKPQLFHDVSERLVLLEPQPSLEPLKPKAAPQQALLATRTAQINTPPSRLNRSAVLRRETVFHRVLPVQKRSKHRVGKSTVFTAMAFIIFAAGLFVSWNGWHANKVVQAQATHLTRIANKASTGTVAAPSTVAPTTKAVANYVVAPSLPRYLTIPKLGVNARVLSVGVNAQGALETPSSVYDTAWYNESAQPGQPGAMLIDGHISSWTTHGVFYGLNKLVAGDTIQIQRGDGQTFTYSVVKTQTYNANNVDMAAAMTPIDPSRPGLNLISCAGDVIPGTSDFNERIIVFASQE